MARRGRPRSAGLPKDVGPEPAARCGASLVEAAATLEPGALRLVGERVPAFVAPEAADEALARKLEHDEESAYQRRGLTLSAASGGEVRLRGLLDVEGAATVRAALDPLSLPQCAADGPVRRPDERTAPQRRADALVDICRAVPAAALRRLACDAAILPAVCNGQSLPLDVGRARLFTGPVRRALTLRDRGCAFPDCDRPPGRCDGHHVRGWADAGPTSLANGVLVCRHHHRTLHERPWTVRIAADGLPEFIPPPHVDPLQLPMRNRYHPRP